MEDLTDITPHVVLFIIWLLWFQPKVYILPVLWLKTMVCQSFSAQKVLVVIEQFANALGVWDF